MRSEVKVFVKRRSLVYAAGNICLSTVAFSGDLGFLSFPLSLALTGQFQVDGSHDLIWTIVVRSSVSKGWAVVPDYK